MQSVRRLDAVLAAALGSQLITWRCRDRLAQQLAAFGAECVLETLGDLEQRKANAIVQDDAVASKAPKITSLDGVLDLAHQTATQVFHVRPSSHRER